MAAARPTEKPPVILTKVEALEHAAERLERMAQDRELMTVIMDAMFGKERDLPADIAPQIRELRQEMPEPRLQVEALREGAKAIRALALEERLIAARMTARGIGA